MESLTTSKVTHGSGVSARQLYYWERKGLITPEVILCGTRRYRRYSDEDIRILRKVRHMRRSGYSLRGIARRLNGG